MLKLIFFRNFANGPKNGPRFTVTFFCITKPDQRMLFRGIIFMFLLRIIKNIPREKNARFYNVNVRGTYGDTSSSVCSCST
jgi:hypothetical protein